MRPDPPINTDELMTATRPNPASVWVFDTRTLGRRPGSMKTWRTGVPAGQQIGLDVVAVPSEGEIELDLRLENLATTQATLEDVFLTLTGRSLRE